MQGAEVKKNFLRFYLDPELLSEEEAKEALREEGVNVELLETRAERFVEKLDAKFALSRGKEKKEEFLNIVDKFKNEAGGQEEDIEPTAYKLAARKQDESISNDAKSDADDIKLMEFMKKNKK